MSEDWGETDEDGNQYIDHPSKEIGRLYKQWDCPDCGHKVRDWADQCSKCGYIREEGRGILVQSILIPTPEDQKDGEPSIETVERAYHRGKKKGLQQVIHDIMHKLPDDREEELTVEEIVDKMKEVETRNTKVWANGHETPVSRWEKKQGVEE